MTNWQCARCRAQVAPGAPRCPHCPSTSFIKPEPEADDMLKIARDGSVTDSAAIQEHPGAGVPMTAAEHPADGTMSPPVSNDDAQVADIEATLEAEQPAEAAPEPEPVPAPAVPPRMPPRRTPPKASDG